MEEDIKILEELKELNYFGDTVFEREAQALENLLTRYKQLEEENKDLKLKERNRELGRYGEIEVHDLINKTLSEDFIPTSLVKEKIDDLEKRGYFGEADAMKDLLERSREDEK